MWKYGENVVIFVMLICSLREQLLEKDLKMSYNSLSHQGGHGRRGNKLRKPSQVGLPFVHHHRTCNNQVHSLCSKVKLLQNENGFEEEGAYVNKCFNIYWLTLSTHNMLSLFGRSTHNMLNFCFCCQPIINYVGCILLCLI